MARFSIANVTPNWFASVMGTGIVANAAVTLPVELPGLRQAAIGVWLLASAMLLFFLTATVLHWVRHPAAARAHHADPVMAHFYGAPPMALLTVGAGTLLIGRDVVGLRAAVAIDAVLWTVGTIAGLVSAVAVPYLAFTRHRNAPDAASPAGSCRWSRPWSRPRRARSCCRTSRRGRPARRCSWPATRCSG